MPPWRTMVTTDRLSTADLWSNSKNAYISADVVVDQVRRIETGFGKDKGSKVSVLYRRHPDVPQKWHQITNGMASILEGFAGTDLVEKWPGVAVSLYVDPTVKNPKTKRTTTGIRYRPVPPRGVAGAREAVAEIPDDDEQAAIRAEEARRHG